MTDTDAVERAAKAIYESKFNEHERYDFDHQSERVQGWYRDYARAALAAADGGEVERLRTALHRISTLDPYGDWTDGDATVTAQSIALAALHADKEGTRD